MADIAPTYTPRYILKYRVGGREHAFLVRGVRGETSTATITRATTFLTNFFTALAPGLPDDLAFISALYIPQDSNVGIPAARPVAVVGGSPLANFKTRQRIAKMQFSGKTSGGSKASFNVWSFAVSVGDDVDPDGEDYVVTAAEDTRVSNAINAISAANLPGIDGTVIAIYSQATVKQHDHYVKRVRKGI